jgi:hypothetical protein
MPLDQSTWTQLARHQHREVAPDRSVAPRPEVSTASESVGEHDDGLSRLLARAVQERTGRSSANLRPGTAYGPGTIRDNKIGAHRRRGGAQQGGGQQGGGPGGVLGGHRVGGGHQGAAQQGGGQVGVLGGHRIRGGQQGGAQQGGAQQGGAQQGGAQQGGAQQGGAQQGGVPGQARTVPVEPVTFKASADDAAPTGVTLAARFASMVAVWSKLGVSFTQAPTVELVDVRLKTGGGVRQERDEIRTKHTANAAVTLFLVDNALPENGGGTTVGAGPGAKILLSDRGRSTTVLAHEMGHAMGLDHPVPGADQNTIMTPTGSMDIDNPTRNPIANYQTLTWPLTGLQTVIHPDP